jgi:hypothetical protein
VGKLDRRCRQPWFAAAFLFNEGFHVTGWRTLLILLVLATVSGCGRDPERGYATIPRERFIETNVALRQIDRAAPEADSLRAEVLAEHGVTEEDLRAFVIARSERPGELAAVWDEIRQRLTDRSAETEPFEMQTALAEEDGTLREVRAREMNWSDMAGTAVPYPAAGEPGMEDPRP